MGNNNVKPLPNNKKSPIISNEKIKLFVFSWNTNLIQFKDDTLSIKFLQPILEKIIRNNCNLVLLCLQQNSNNSKIIPAIHRVMIKLGYLMPYVDGKSSDHSEGKLKMIVFAHNNWWNKLKKKYTGIKIEKDSGSCGVFTGRGYTLLKIKLPLPFGKLAFGNIHNLYDSSAFKKIAREERKIWLKKLPNSNADKRIIYRQLYQKYRLKSLKKQNECINKLMKLINNDDLQFIVGDLNYRVVKSNPYPIDSNNNSKLIYYTNPDQVLKKISSLLKDNNRKKLKRYIADHDELTLFKRVSIDLKKFEEGINDLGPQFMPTCKMMINRNPKECGENINFDEKKRKEKYVMKKNRKKILTTEDECYKFGNINHRVPSWCDRIMYQSKYKNIITIKCLEYNSFNGIGFVTQSDHNPVYGIYELKEYGT